MNNQIQKSSPRDVLMHLLSIAALYVSVFSTLSLIFDYVNVFFPDPLNPYYNPGDSIRWFLALFIIIFPVFLWTSRFLKKDLEMNPEKSELRIRKWLTYLTLFAAAILIIGDLVALIYNFLQGELTIRFTLKIISVFVLATAVFGYYFYDLRRNPREFSPKARIFVWVVGLVALALVAYGFVVAGSPFKARLVRFDNQRISDLQTIQSQIVYFWQQKEKLPQTLTDLTDNISGFKAPVDPENRQPYEYKTTGSLSFKLCANFSLAAEAAAVTRPLYPETFPMTKNDNWNHAAGQVCFERKIDPELYKPIKRD